MYQRWGNTRASAKNAVINQERKFEMTRNRLKPRTSDEQVFLVKFPWTNFVARVCENLSHVKRKLVKFSKAAIYTWTNFPCPKAGMTSFETRLLGKAKVAVITLVTEKRYTERKHAANCVTPIYSQAAQSYPVLLITLYLYINSILKIIRKSCVINLLRYIFI
jgi:hypothetical protein